MQAELATEEARIRYKTVEIQNMILPLLDSMNAHIAHAKTLIHDNNFSVVDHLIELAAEIQVAIHTSHVLQDTWDKTVNLIFKVHSDFLSHFGITI